MTGKVAALIDWNDPTHTVAQSTSTSQCTLPAAHSDFAGALTLTTTGFEYYKSTRTATQWKYLTDGSGFEKLHVLTPIGASIGTTQVIDSPGRTNAAVTHSPFHYSGSSASAASLRILIRNGTTVLVVQITNNHQLFVPTWTTWKWRESDATKITVYDRSRLVYSGGTAASPSTADPDRPLGMFDADDRVHPLKCRWVMSAYTLPWTDEQRYLAFRLMRERFGL